MAGPMTLENVLPNIPVVESPLYPRMRESLAPEILSIGDDLHREGLAVFDFPVSDFALLAEKVVCDVDPEYPRSDFEQGKTDSLFSRTALTIRPWEAFSFDSPSIFGRDRSFRRASMAWRSRFGWTALSIQPILFKHQTPMVKSTLSAPSGAPPPG